MPKMELPGSNPVVDFANFHYTGSNLDIAKDIAMIFLSFISQDDLQWTTECDKSNDWIVTIGTGGSGMKMGCMTQSHQRAIIASAFADYAVHNHTSLYLGLPEYQALKELLEDLENSNYGYGHYTQKQKIINNQIQILKTTINEFEKAYLSHDPGFLFNLIKMESTQ